MAASTTSTTASTHLDGDHASAPAASSQDPLKQLNDELRDKPDAAGPWLPLESNPEVFTSFGHRVGLSPDLTFVDVLGLDPELLAMTPRPCCAVILLFPCSEKIYQARAAEARKLSAAAALQQSYFSPAAKKAFHIQQVASFGNACGTIAAVHALTNLAGGGVPEGGVAAAFRREHSSQSAEQRGQALLRQSAFKRESDEAAVHAAAQTGCPGREADPLDHHFTVPLWQSRAMSWSWTGRRVFLWTTGAFPRWGGAGIMLMGIFSPLWRRWCNGAL